MVLSSLCSGQWKLSLELRRGWDEWVVLVWSASLPSLSLSLYLVLRIFLSFIFWWFSISSLDLLIISWNCPEFRQIILSLVLVSKKGALSQPEHPFGNGAADQTTIPKKEFGFLSGCTHLTFPFLNWTYIIHFILASLNKYFNLSGFKIWFCSLNKWIWTIHYYHFLNKP